MRATQTIELDAVDDAGAPVVTVFDDDGTICTLRAAPYSCMWRPTGADVGRATLLASAVDSDNRSTLGIVRVTVARFEADLTRRVRGRRVTGRLVLPAAVERALGCKRRGDRATRPRPPHGGAQAQLHLRRAAADAGAVGSARASAATRWSNPPRLTGAMSALPASVDDVSAGLRAAGYLPGESTALVSYLAARLGKPVLVEGPAGVGKTELAKALSRYLDRRLVRLQCYEGLDEAKALYEWNYRKQLLRIQTEAEGTGWDAVQDDIFGEEFLLSRPLMQAIAADEPVVLLIDEIDKTDQEFEAMLLELLSDFQITIPELGRIEARTMPVVLLTSNNTRELTEALKRRCLYLWLDYPDTEHELEIVRLHAPELSETVARKLVDLIHQVRELDLKKPPSIAESIDWARALLLLGADDISPAVFKETMSIIVKHRTDLDTVAERVGVRLAA